MVESVPPRRVHILKTRPRDWEQILLTWVKAAVAFLVLGLVLLAALTFHADLSTRYSRSPRPLEKHVLLTRSRRF
jgi:hypothetical protein